jgi:hypothetical protein
MDFFEDSESELKRARAEFRAEEVARESQTADMLAGAPTLQAMFGEFARKMTAMDADPDTTLTAGRYTETGKVSIQRLVVDGVERQTASFWEVWLGSARVAPPGQSTDYYSVRLLVGQDGSAYAPNPECSRRKMFGLLADKEELVYTFRRMPWEEIALRDPADVQHELQERLSNAVKATVRRRAKRVT